MTHHVDDLLEGQPEGEVDGVGLVVDGALQLVVVAHEVLQQAALVLTTVSSFREDRLRDHNTYHGLR